MPLPDAQRSIVVVIELQGKLVDMVHRPALVLEGTKRLLKLADLFSVPVVLTEQYPRGIGSTHQGIREVYDGLATPKFFLEKTAFGCCGDSGFEELLATFPTIELTGEPRGAHQKSVRSSSRASKPMYA